jgi:hypothetical protein
VDEGVKRPEEDDGGILGGDDEEVVEAINLEGLISKTLDNRAAINSFGRF